MKVDGDDIYIFDKFIALEYVIPLIIKKNRCKKIIPKLNISWTVLADHIKSRSNDDIRNYWNLKLLPLLVPVKL